jgi:hypothetical protein
MATNDSDVGFIPDNDVGFVPDAPVASANSAQSAAPISQSPLDYAAKALGEVPLGLLHLGKNIIGTGSELIHHPVTTASNLAQGAGSFLYHLPANIDIATGGQPYGKYYPNIQSAPEVQNTNAFSTGGFAASMLPVGKAAQLGEKGIGILSDLLPQFSGKNFLSKVASLSAGGAASAPLYGQSPGQGIANNLLLGGVGHTLGSVANKANKLATAYQTVAPALTSDLSKIPKMAYQDAAKNYVGITDQAKAKYNQLDNDPNFTKDIPNNASAFPNAVQNQLDELQDREDTPEVDTQRKWLQSFVDPSLNINRFKDITNIDKKLNNMYKTYNVENNPGLVGQYAGLKQALDQHLDEMGDAVPDQMQQTYQDAKDLWKKKSSFERLPGTNTPSPWWQQFSHEKDQRAVAMGTPNENGIQAGHPGNFLKNSLKPSSAQADQTANINHLSNILSPEMMPYVASAYLNPEGLPNVSIRKIAKQFNALNDESQNLLMGSNNPSVNNLRTIANTPHFGALGKFLDRLGGMIVGSHVGHPLMGWAAGAMMPNLFAHETIKAPTGESPNFLQRARYQIPGSQARRQFAYLPAAYQLQSSGQNQQ